MSDLISRQDAIKTVIRMCSPICDWELEKKAYTDCVIDEINSLPSAEPKTGWIPVSERLPENNGCMLVTIDDAIEFGKYEDGEWSIWVCEHWDEWDAKGVIAWMPLPEPWKGGDDE